MPHISQLNDLFFSFGLQYILRQEIGHLGSDDLFFGLLFTLLHFTVVGKNLGNRAEESNLLNHPPQYRKMAKNGQFCRIIPPMFNIDLYPWRDAYLCTVMYPTQQNLTFLFYLPIFTNPIIHHMSKVKPR